MHFKVIIVSVACLAFLVQPADSFGLTTKVFGTIGNFGSLGNLFSIPFQLASIPLKVAKTKAAAVVKGASEIASVMATGAGLKVRALGTAIGSIKGAMGDGLIAIGDRISKAGDEFVAEKLSNSGNIILPGNGIFPGNTIVAGNTILPGNTIILADSPVVETVNEEIEVRSPTFMERAFMGNREQEIIEVPEETLSAVELKVREPMAIVETAPVAYGSNKVSRVWKTLNEEVVKVRSEPASAVAFEIEEVEAPRVYKERRPRIEAFRYQKK